MDHLSDLSEKKLDVLGLDVCRGMILEILYDLKDISKYIVGSQSDQDGWSWPYSKMVEMMEKNIPIEELLKNLVKEHKNFYSKELPNLNRDRNENDSLSVVLSNKLENLKESFNFLVDSLLSESFSYAEKITMKTSVLDASLITEREVDSDSIDLWTFLELLRDSDINLSPETQKLLKQTLEDLKKVVIFHGNTSSVVRSKGVSIRYFKSDFDKASEYPFNPGNTWIKFLEKIFAKYS